MSVDDGINMEESSDSKLTRNVGAQSSTEKWVESEVVSLIHCQVASNVSFLIFFVRYHFTPLLFHPANTVFRTVYKKN